MILICCVDDHFGLSFNKRRCSSDSTVSQDILSRVGNGKLYVDSYSAKLFGESPAVIVDENSMADAGTGDYAFVERVNPESFQNKIERVIIYFWNRRYPSDVKLTLSPVDWTRTVIAEFPGHSHEKITVEEWTRRE